MSEKPQPEVANPRRSRWRRRFRVLFILFVGLAVTFGAWRLYLGVRLASEYAKIREAGYPISAEELAAWYENTPTTLEGAKLLGRAIEAHVDWYDDDAKWDALMNAGMAFDDDGTLTGDRLALLHEYLQVNEEALSLFHEAAATGPTRFPLDFVSEDWTYALMPHYSDVREASRLLAWDAAVSVRDGDAAGVVRALETLWWTAESVAYEPFYISQLVRVACHNMLFARVEDVLNHAALSDAQLLQLASTLGPTDFTEGFVMGLVGDRCADMEYFSNPDYSPVMDSEYVDMFDELRPGLGHFVNRAIALAGIQEIDRLAYLPLMETLIEATAQDYHTGRALRASFESGLDKVQVSPSLKPFTLISLPVLTSTGALLAHNQAKVGLMLTALALERFRLNEGAIPDTLDGLVPIYLPEIPIDPFDGAPLRYLPESQAYTVYSIGMNESDEAGLSGGTHFEGDIILRIDR